MAALDCGSSCDPAHAPHPPPLPGHRYLNSCVGADTLRHFILLLAWLAAALAYCLGLGAAMGARERAAILAHTRRVARVRRRVETHRRAFALATLQGGTPWAAEGRHVPAAHQATEYLP